MDNDMNDDMNEEWTEEEEFVSEETEVSREETTGNDEASAEMTGEEDRINLNMATKEELMTIPGINEKAAEAVINYREKNGPYRDVKELSNLKDIKRENVKTLQKWTMA
jgi:competence protein ComEA